jgi:hypothetical protein
MPYATIRRLVGQRAEVGMEPVVERGKTPATITTKGFHLDIQ